MDSQLRARAEARLEEAARSAGIADPRPPLRERLRTLRETRRPDFDRAIEHYEKHVLPALAGADPLAAWIEYGRFLAGIDGDGKVVTIDERGRAADWVADTPHGLVLFIPDDLAVAVLALCQPLEPSAAQEATLRLLVDRKLSLN